MRWTIACVVALILLGFLNTANAGEPVGPDWDSNQILEVRGQAKNDMILLNYRSETTGGGKAPLIDTGIAFLGVDFDHIITNNSQAITDYKFCRVYVWSPSGNIFDNQSCYADPAFRKIELSNRLKLGKILGKVGAKNFEGIGDDHSFWLAQEFAVQNSEPKSLTMVESKVNFNWQVSGETVAILSQDGLRFDAHDTKRFARYLARHINIHPQIRQAILDRQILPYKIEIIHRKFEGASIETISFSSSQRIVSAYPLPPNMSASIFVKSEGTTAKAVGIKKSLSAIAGTANSIKPSFEELLQKLELQAKLGDSIQTTLTFLKLTQFYGGALFSEKQKMDRLRKIMPDVALQLQTGEGAKFMAASNLAGSAGKGNEREVAAAYLADAKNLDELDFGTFRLVTFANLARITTDSAQWDKRIFENVPSLTDSYWTHIAAHPWASNTFKDLGDTEYSQFNTFAAWDAWDLGKAIDPDWQGGSLKSLVELENKIRTAMPDNF